MRRFVLVLTLVPYFTLIGTHQGTESAPAREYVPPKRLVLTRHDVPHTFRQVTARSLTNAEADRADHLSAGTFARHGRIASYETSFQYSGHRYAWVGDNVIAFTAASGAHWEFERLVKKGRERVAGQPFQPMAVKRLGSEASGFVYLQMLGRTPAVCGIAIFRRGSYAAWVISCGLTAGYSLHVSPALARVIDKRIRSAETVRRTTTR